MLMAIQGTAVLSVGTIQAAFASSCLELGAPGAVCRASRLAAVKEAAGGSQCDATLLVRQLTSGISRSSCLGCNACAC